MRSSNCQNKAACPVCGEGNLTPQLGKNIVEIGGELRDVELLYLTCDHCGSDIAGQNEIDHNKRLMAAMKTNDSRKNKTPPSQRNGGESISG